MAFSLLSKSLLSRMSVSAVSTSPELSDGGDGSEIMAEFQESGFSHLMNKELYPVREKVVDENCPYDAEPFRLLSGESIEFMGLLHDEYVIAISNYRLFTTQEDGFYSVPLGLIETVEVFGTKDKLLVLCRDARTFKLLFSSQFKCKLWQERILESFRRLNKDPKTAFAFVHRAYNKDRKMAKQDLLRLGVEEAGGVVEWVEGEEEVDTEGTNHLLSLKAHSETWRDEVMTMEYERTGMGHPHKLGTEKRPWRITQCNDKYKLCGTYPKLLVVPNSISDEELQLAAKFRMSGRIPAVVWRHQTNGCVIARSSQPLVGVLGWRSPEDEKLLFAISKSCSVESTKRRDSNNIHLRSVTTYPLVQASSSAPQLHPGKVATMNGNGVANGYLNGSDGPYSDSDDDDDDDEEGLTCGSVGRKLMVFDLRSYTAALGNRAKGGGCECTDYYPNCEVQYKCLPNIHAVRKSFLQLRAVLLSDDQLNFLSGLEGTQWLHYLCQLLSVACEVVGVVNDDAQPILIHCSDGWDRTTQVVALAELMLDPYYRTIKGFKVLTEREWLGYGHKFGERCGVTTDDANQQSPVFLQWLDCVHQLTRQYPCDFQFNENFLLKLGRHVYSCLYGTFLYNSMKEREQNRVNVDTTSVWALLHENNQDIINYLYSGDIIENKILRPVTHIKSMLLWREMYTTSLLIPYQSPSPSTESMSPQPIVSGENSLSTTPSPSHHTQLTQTSYLATDDNDTNVEDNLDDAMMESTNENQDAAPDLAGNDLTTTTEVKGQLDTPQPQEVIGQVSGTTYEVKGQEDVTPGEVNGEAILSKESQGDLSSGGEGDMPNGHLLTVEQRNGLLSSSASERELANVLTKQHPSTVIEMRNLTHVDAVRRDNEKGHPLPSPALPVVNGEPLVTSITTTRSNSEVVLSERTQNGLVSTINDSNDLGQTSNKQVESTTNKLTQDRERETDFISETSPQLTRSIEVGKTGSRFALGVDGLPCSLDPLQKRVRELELKHRREVEDLRLSLKEAQIQVAEAVKLQKQQQQQRRLQLEQDGGVGEGDRLLCSDGSRPSLHSDDNMPSPSSLHSWDCVDQDDEHGVRWIPDHAATHCQICGAAFWTALRKHHCRSCGGIFCATCSNFFCPVPHEQLFVDVRVCEKCYYRLDGHLKNGITPASAPT